VHLSFSFVDPSQRALVWCHSPLDELVPQLIQFGVCQLYTRGLMRLPIVRVLECNLSLPSIKLPKISSLRSQLGSLAQWNCRWWGRPVGTHVVGLIIISVFMGCACAIASGALAMADATQSWSGLILVLGCLQDHDSLSWIGWKLVRSWYKASEEAISLEGLARNLGLYACCCLSCCYCPHHALWILAMPDVPKTWAWPPIERLRICDSALTSLELRIQLCS